MYFIKSIWVVIGILIIVSCDNSSSLQNKADDNENLAEEASEEVIDQYHSRYDLLFSVVQNNIQIADSLYDVLIFTDDSAQNSTENQIPILKAQATFVRIRSMYISNYFIDQISELIKFSQDKYFGRESDDEPMTTKHYKVENVGNHKCYRLFSIELLENLGNIKAPVNLYVGEDPQNPKCTYLIDSLSDYREDLITVLLHESLIDFDELNQLKFKVISEKEIFQNELKLQLSNFNEQEKEFITAVYDKLTLPEVELNERDSIPWITARFFVPLIGAAESLMSFNLRVKQAEIAAYEYLINQRSKN